MTFRSMRRAMLATLLRGPAVFAQRTGIRRTPPGCFGVMKVYLGKESGLSRESNPFRDAPPPLAEARLCRRPTLLERSRSLPEPRVALPEHSRSQNWFRKLVLRRLLNFSVVFDRLRTPKSTLWDLKMV